MENIVDWPASWKQMLQTTKRIEACNANYWDKKASDFDENSANLTELTNKQLSRIELNKEYTLLDIGAGTGRLTIPIAKQVKLVTAVEPSKNMLAILDQKIKKEQITNVIQINQPWETLHVPLDVPVHDVVVGSLSLFMIDIEQALKNIDYAAKKQAYLFMSACTWMDDELHRILQPEQTTKNHSDCTYIFNILQGIGIFAHIDFLEYEYSETYANRDDALSKFVARYRIPCSRKHQMMEYLRSILVETDGKLLLKRKNKVAMIWWTKIS